MTIAVSAQYPVERKLHNAQKSTIICQGDPFELGFQQGVALGSMIAQTRQSLSQLEAFRLQQPVWLPYFAYRWVAERKAMTFLHQALSVYSPAMLARIRGLAKGADQTMATMALFNALEPVLSSVAGCTVCPGACSAVAIRGRRSVTGEPIIAHNFDYLPLVQPFYVMRESRPAGQYRSIEFTLAPLAGAVDAMNEKGLCITNNYSYTIDENRDPAPPISMVIAEAMARCSTVTEAAEWIASQPRVGGGILMLADAKGDIASLELSNTRSHLRRPAPEKDHLCHSNAFANAEMIKVQAPQQAVFNNAAPRTLRGKRLHKSAEIRDHRYHELLTRDIPLDTYSLNAIMADHGSSGEPGEYTPCVHSDYWHTTACLQFYPQSRRVLFSFSTSCQATFQELVL